MKFASVIGAFYSQIDFMVETELLYFSESDAGRQSSVHFKIINSFILI